jgi:hypothetical protein
VIATSFASIKEFFGREPVSLIDEARVECYKTWRVKEHKVRDITLRHDLHALSKFFGLASSSTGLGRTRFAMWRYHRTKTRSACTC